MIANLNMSVIQRKCLYKSTEDCVYIVSRGMHFKPFSPIIAMLKNSLLCKKKCIAKHIFLNPWIASLLECSNSSIHFTTVVQQLVYTLHYFSAATRLYTSLLECSNSSIHFTTGVQQLVYTLHYCSAATRLYTSLL